MAKLLKSIENNILFWLTGFLLFFIPVYPKFPLFSVNGTYVAIRLEDIFVALTVGIFGIIFIKQKKWDLLKKDFTKLIILYLLIGLLSVISGIFITKNITPHIAFLHFLRRIEYISLLFVVYTGLKNVQQTKILAMITSVSTFAVIAYGIGQKYFGWPVVSTMNKEFSKGLILKLTWWARVNSTFAGHYDLAAYMVMLIPIIMIILMVSKKWYLKIYFSILGIFCYYILILTASRVSFGAFLISGLLVLILSQKKWWIIVLFLIFSITGMVFSDDLGQRYAATFKIDLSFMSGMVKVKPEEIAIAPTLTPIPTEILSPAPTLVYVKPVKIKTPTSTPTPTPTLVATASAEYFESTEQATNRSTDIRLKVEWPRAILAFEKNPLLGTGFSSVTLSTDNDYLRMLAETGILGFLAFFAFVFEVLRIAIGFISNKLAEKRDKLIIIGIIGSSIGYFLNATFIDVFEASKIAFFFWILAGAALKIIDLENEDLKSKKDK